MTTMTVHEASAKYWSMYQEWQTYCDKTEVAFANRNHYTYDELIFMSRMDFYYHYSYVRAIRLAGNQNDYFYHERYAEMVRARTSLAHWKKMAS